MGKDKQKGLRSSSKPASSSEFTNSGFIGFSGANQEGLDPEFENVFKGLKKKDSITKLKALQDFKGLFEKLDETSVPGVMKSWSTAYQRLGRDNDWKVREATNQTFVDLIKVVKKGLAPQLKSIFGTWLCNLFDTYREVANAAKNALSTAFPEKKQAEAILFCSKDVLSFVQDTFEEIQTPAKSADAPIKESYERVISTTLMALGFVIDNLSDIDNQKLIENYHSLFSPKMWSYLTNKEYPLIRKAGYSLIAVLSKKLPELIEKNMDKYAPLMLFTAISETEQIAHQVMWESVLVFLRRFPDAWKAVNPRKQTLPKLWELLRNAGYKSAATTFNNLVPFLSLIPTEVIGEGPEFMKELFSNIWEGFKKESTSRVVSLEVLRGYLECVKYFVTLGRKTNRKLEDLALNEHLFLSLEYFLTNDSPSSKDSLAALSETFSRITFSNCSEESITAFWGKLASLSAKIFSEEKEKLRVFCSNLGDFCADVKIRYSSQQSDEKAITSLRDFSQKTFSAAFPFAKSQEGVTTYLPLISKLAQSFGLSSLLKGSPIGSDLFYRNQLVHWTTDWINSLKIENPRALFRFAANYFKDPSVTDPHTAKEISHEWVAYLGLVVSSGQSTEGGLLYNLQVLEALLKEFHVATHSTHWKNVALDELAKTLIAPFNTESKVGSSEISLFGSIIGYLMAGENNVAPNLLQDSTQALILSSLSNSLNQVIASPSLDKEANALAILQCVEQILNAIVSENPLKEVEWQLLVSVFSLRAYVRTDIKDDSETIEGRIRQLSMKIWKEVSEKLKNQIVSHKGFSQSLISSIHNSLNGTMTSLTLKRIPLFGEQANAILHTFNDFSLIDSILLVQDRNQLHDSISKVLLIDFLGSDISYIRVHLQSEEVPESKLSNYFGILSFYTQVLQHVQLEKLLDKESEEKRVWIPVELLFAHFIAEEHTRFRSSAKIVVNSFAMFQDNIKLYVEDQLVQEFSTNPKLLENVIKVLQKESNSRGGFQALALRHILQFLKGKLEIVANIVSKLPIPSEDEILKSDSYLSTFQAIFPFLSNYKVSSNLLAGWEPLLQNNPDELRRRVELAYLQSSENIAQPAELLGHILSSKQLLSYSKFESPQALALYASISKLSAKLIHKPQLLLDALRSIKTSLVFAEENYFTLIFDVCRSSMKASNAGELELSVKYQALSVINVLRKSMEDEVFATAVKNSVKLQREHDLFINEMYSTVFKILGEDLEKQFGVYSSTILPLLSDITLRAPSTTLAKNKDLLYSLLTADNETLQINSLSLLLRLLQESNLVQIAEKKSEDATNIPEALVQLISSNPELGEVIDNKFFGYLLGWSLLLSVYEQIKEMRSDISSFLRKESGAVTTFLGHLFDIIDINKDVASDFATQNGISLLQSHKFSLFASHLYFRVLKNLPVLARTWWTYDLDRKWTANVDKYTKNLSPFLIQQEVSSVGAFKHDFDNFKLKAGKKEITASYEKDDVLLEIVIRLPDSYPLRTVEVDYTKQTGASEALWRKWLLSMTTLLMTQDGSILDAVLLWKNSLDKHFEGVDVCPICYSLFDQSNRTLPNLACKTCRNKFHSSCMYKWIKVSHNSTCPLCKSPFN